MSLFADHDDIAERARASGMTATQYMVRAAENRKAKTYKDPARELRSLLSRAEQRAADAERALADDRKRLLALLDEAREQLRREKFRRSWMQGVWNVAFEDRNDLVGFVPKRVTVIEIIDQIASQVGIPATELRSNGRRKDLAPIRFYGYWRARNETLASLPQIGKAFGGRDHTTVLHGIRRFDDGLSAGEQWAVDLVEGRR